MKKVTCPNCGNTRKFREWMLVHRWNYFIQQRNGRVIKDVVEEKQDCERDSVILCDVCGQKIEDELYHQFLDNYTETLFVSDKKK